MKSLLMGTRYKPLQSVNYHDGLDWLCLVGQSQWVTVIGWFNFVMPRADIT
jgi:hypothetical protein